MPEPKRTLGFVSALPFWLSILVIAFAVIACWYGGWTILLLPFYALAITGLLDKFAGLNDDNPDPQGSHNLYWYKLITWIWLPIQLALIFGSLWWVTRTEHLSDREGILLMIGVGVVSGAVGIVFAHELIHQKNRFERRLGELLMCSVLYGHFVTEHLAVHHTHVGTTKDAATARYNESFYRFFPRVLYSSLRSAWSVEADRQTRRNRPVLSLENPFWRYVLFGLAFLMVAWLIGGWTGVLLYLLQSLIAVIQLEQINYIEHYGIVRKRLANGKFEQVAPRHSWNAAHRFSNYLLINLQRHSDHHVKPDRRYPLLQTYSEAEAPQLPYGYPLMVLITYNPWLWRRIMNPRVRKWRSMFYPERLDWSQAA